MRTQIRNLLSLISVLCIITLLYHSSDEIYSIVCSSIYMAVFYVPIFLYSIQDATTFSFVSVIVLRKKGKISIARENLYKINFIAFFYAFIFLVVYQVIGLKTNDIYNRSEMMFSVFIIQYAGWFFIGTFYYLIFVICKKKAVSFFVSWTVVCFNIFSSSVLFHPGKKIYNIYKNMFVFQEKNNIVFFVKRNYPIVIFIILCISMIMFFSKKMDLIEKRKGIV